MFQLISATPSPYARKVRIALAEKGLPFKLVTEVPWNSTTVTPKYNPLEKLPVLILEDGSSVYKFELHPTVSRTQIPRDTDATARCRRHPRGTPTGGSLRWRLRCGSIGVSGYLSSRYCRM